MTERSLTVREPEWSDGAVALGLTLGGRKHAIRIGIDGLRPVEADFALPLALIPAMTADRLELGAPVSPRLLETVPLLQAVLADGSDGLSPVPLAARSSVPAGRGARGTACFFSGGVDSFHTLLRNRDSVSHLIFVHGFDIALDGSEELRGRAAGAARNVAGALGMSLVEAETDVRRFSDPLVPWGPYYISVLAAIGMLLADRFSHLLVPAGGTYSDPVYWSHPLLDPLWSTEATQIVNDGAGARRIDKLAYLADEELAMRWLRVCWENPGGEYNCGRCEKCLRTMIGLRAVGALERCATLPDRIDPGAIAAMPITTGFDLGYARENRAALERLGTQPELVAALDEAMARTEVSYGRVLAAERRAEDAERALASLRRSRRYRLASSLAYPLDRLRSR